MSPPTPPRSSLAPCDVPRPSPTYPGFCRCGHALDEHGGGWIGASLPGSPLVQAVDAGGERWSLDGRPLHAGDGIDLLTEGASSPCPSCAGEGRIGENDERRACPGCAGRGYRFLALWLPVRFEYRNDGDGTGPAYLYPALPGLWTSDRHAIEVRPGDGLRARLPTPRGDR